MPTVRPNSDVTATGWTPSTGASVFATIDESASSDADYALSPVFGMTALVMGLDAAVLAGTHRIQLRMSVAVGTQEVRVRLLNASNVEQGASAYQTVTTTPTTYTFTVVSTGAADRVEVDMQTGVVASGERYTYLGLGTDANDLTILTKHASARYIYVKPTGDDDAGDGLSHATAYATVAKAWTMVTSSQGDWILLSGGDAHPGNLDVWSKRGFSAAYPLVITSYDSSDPTNTAKFGTIRARTCTTIENYWFFNGTDNPGAGRYPHDFVAITGLHFDKPTPNPTGGSGLGLFVLGRGDGFLIENCLFTKCQVELTGPTNPSGNYIGPSLTNACMRRSGSYMAINDGTGHHCAVHSGQAPGLIVEDCVIDHAGWMPGGRGTGVPEGQTADIFKHALYIGVSSKNVFVRRNLISRPSSHGMQCRGGATVMDNVLGQCPYPILVAEQDIGSYSPAPYGVAFTDCSASVTGNLISGTTSIQGATVVNGGTAIGFGGVLAANTHLVQNNLIISAGSTYLGGNLCPLAVQTDLAGGQKDVFASYEPNYTDLTTYGTPVPGGDVPLVPNYSTMLADNNIVARWGAIAFATNGLVGSDSANGSATRTNNVFDNEGASGSNVTFASLSGGYLAPTRDVASYAVANGYADEEALYAYAAAHPETNWALNINTWVRAGYASALNAYLFVDVANPTFTTKHGYGNLANNRVDLRPLGKRIIIDATTSTNGNYRHVANFSAAKAIYAAGDWILFPGGQTSTVPLDFNWIGPGGLSAQNPTVIGTFDPADKENDAKFNTLRHTIDVSGQGETSPIQWTQTDKSYVAVVNFIFKRVPAEASSCGLTFLGQNCNYWLLENCTFDGVNLTAQSQPNLALTGITSVGTLATATLAVSNSLMQTGDKVAMTDATPSAYNGTYTITVVDSTHFTYTFAGGVGASTVHGTYNPPYNRISDDQTRTDMTIRFCGIMAAGSGLINGNAGNMYFSGVRRLRFEACVDFCGGISRGVTRSTPFVSGGPSLYKHGMYIDDYTDDVKIMDTLCAWDACNLKLTGGNYYIQNMVTIRSPMSWIYAATTSNHANTSFAASSLFRSENHLAVHSDDVSVLAGEETPRGSGPSIYHAAPGSYYKNGLLLNQDNPTTVNRLGVTCSGNGLPYTTQLLIDGCVFGDWVQDTAASPDAYTTITFTNNVWGNATAGSNTLVTAMDAGFQARLTAAKALNVHTSLRTAFPAYLGSVAVGGSNLATEFNVVEYMAYNPIPSADPAVLSSWAALVQYHYRSKLAGTT